MQNQFVLGGCKTDKENLSVKCCQPSSSGTPQPNVLTKNNLTSKKLCVKTNPCINCPGSLTVGELFFWIHIIGLCFQSLIRGLFVTRLTFNITVKQCNLHNEHRGILIILLQIYCNFSVFLAYRQPTCKQSGYVVVVNGYQ